MAPRRRTATAGFTLIELLLVTAIISIIVLAFQPSFAKSIADKRAASAVAEFVRIGRRARADAIGLQRAHLLAIQPGAGGTGIVQLLRGNSTHCDLEAWATLAGTCTPSPTVGSACPDQLNLNDSHWSKDPYSVHLRQVPVAQKAGVKGILESASMTPEISLCYEPQGITRWSVSQLGSTMTFSTLALTSSAAAGGGFLWAMGLMQGPTKLVGVPIFVTTPLGSPARRLQ